MPEIFFICPDNTTPSGGVRKLYDMVNVLNSQGFSATLVHETAGFRTAWFEHATKVDYVPAVRIAKDDILVIPEVYGYNIINLWPGVRKVIFNQNAYNTLKGFSLQPEYAREVYGHQDVLGVIVKSDHDHTYLRELFPGVKISKIPFGIDERLFSYHPDKKRIIACMPRKMPQAFNHLINLLTLRNKIKGFELSVIDNVTLPECAAMLKESLFFLSFSDEEGFGLPPAEAMACGNVVVGFHGNGGKEFFRDEFCFPIESNDILAFARQVEQIVADYEHNPEKYAQMGRKASRFIAENYYLDREVQASVAFWKKILGR